MPGSSAVVVGAARRRPATTRPGAAVLRTIVVAVAGVAGLAGCGDSEPAPEGLSVSEGMSVELVLEGLDRPTQMTLTDEGELVVAQLAGGESDGRGQVVLIDDGDRRVLVDGLVAPTGVAVVGDQLWIMEQRRLSVGPLSGGERRLVLDELPFNGRSNGTLTVLDDGRVLYDTSGRARGTEVEAGSGRLWTIRPGEEPVELASGFKHAYAHVVDGEGRLWTTEIGDGTYDGRAPEDELVEVVPGADHGWPRCVGDNRAVGETASCEGVPRSHALFGPNATPTSVVVAPWDPELLIVALWVTGEVVSVPRSIEGRPHTPTTLVSGLERPQHLLVDSQGRLLVVEHGAGRVLALGPD